MDIIDIQCETHMRPFCKLQKRGPFLKMVYFQLSENYNNIPILLEQDILLPSATAVITIRIYNI